jgi:glycosyltransferase involved in cell wall biosynthesis
MTKPFLSVVIPAYNEEHRILSTLEGLDEYLLKQPYTWEVVVADDGSTDQTTKVVKKFSKGRSNFSLQSIPHGGKGSAVRAGMLFAKGEYRFLCDADLSMPIQHLKRFLPPKLTRFDIALGSREVVGAHRFGESPIRHIQGRFFNLFVRLIAVPGIHDTQCGFKCFRDEVAISLFSLQRCNGWGFDVEILFLARKLGFRMIEIPIDWHHNPNGGSQRLQDGFLMGLETLRLRWNAFRGKYGILN